MVLTDVQRKAIVEDFFVIFQTNYGDNWLSSFTRRLTPSPIKELAEKHGVKQCDIKQVRRQIKVVGHYMEIIRLLREPNYPAPVDAPFWV